MTYKLVDKIIGKGYEYIKHSDVECWYKDGKLHRLEGPALIYYDNGNVTKESWYKDGEWHRLDGPAMIHYEDGDVTVEYWYKDDKCHRLDGPAVIYYEDGNVTEEQWYKDSKELHKEDFTSLDLINHFKAYSLFTPTELVRIRNDL